MKKIIWMIVVLLMLLIFIFVGIHFLRIIKHKEAKAKLNESFKKAEIMNKKPIVEILKEYQAPTKDNIQLFYEISKSIQDSLGNHVDDIFNLIKKGGDLTLDERFRFIEDASDIYLEKLKEADVSPAEMGMVFQSIADCRGELKERLKLKSRIKDLEHQKADLEEKINSEPIPGETDLRKLKFTKDLITAFWIENPDCGGEKDDDTIKLYKKHEVELKPFCEEPYIALWNYLQTMSFNLQREKLFGNKKKSKR